MNLITTYYAIEIQENGIWIKPANWMVDKKWLKDRVTQEEGQGYKVRIKRVKEYIDEEVVRLEDL